MDTSLGAVLQKKYSKDKDLTVYRPELRSIAKTMGSTILLSQMLYWDERMREKGKIEFYKFKLPPENDNCYSHDPMFQKAAHHE